MSKKKIYGTIQYKNPRRAGLESVSISRPEPDMGEGLPEVLEIAGHLAGSKEEYRLAQALEKYHLEYEYQVYLWGGLYILDFVVLTPLAIPVEVNGEYWHLMGDKENDDALRLARLRQIFGVDPVVMWDYQMGTQAEVDALVIEKLM